MATCATDRDCPDTGVCYNTSWTGYTAQCLCSSWFGFSGSNCNDVFATPTALWRFITSVLIIIGWSFGICVGLYEVRRLAKYKREWSVTHTCQVQLTLGCSFCIVAELLGEFTNARPHELLLFLPGTDVKTTPLFYPKQILTTLGYSCIFLGLATLPFHWRELANQAFRPNKKKLTYIKPLIVFEAAFALITLIFVAISMPTIAYIAALPFIFIVILSYGICGLALYRVLTRVASIQQAEQKTRFLSSAQNVANTSLKMFVIGVFVMAFSLSFALTGFDAVWRELSPPGKLSPPVIIGTFNSVSLLAAALFGQYYLSLTIRSSLARSSSLEGFGSNSNKSPLVGPSNTRRQLESFSGEVASGKPDSIVDLDSPKDIKKKAKALAKKREPRLRAITDTSEIQSTVNTQFRPVSIEVGDNDH